MLRGIVPSSDRSWNGTLAPQGHSKATKPPCGGFGGLFNKRNARPPEGFRVYKFSKREVRARPPEGEPGNPESKTLVLEN